MVAATKELSGGLVRQRVERSDILRLLDDLRPRLGTDEERLRLWEVSRRYVTTGLPTLVPLLPCLFTISGKPMTLDRHFPFESFFKTWVAQKTVVKAGRQVGKTRSLAAQGITNAVCIPFFNTIYVTPLYEQVRRFSSEYVRSMISDSPFQRLWVDYSTAQNVLQRSFRNRSSMYFTYAFKDCDRVRGLSGSKFAVDEAQDLNPEWLDVIRETVSASDWQMEQYTGTPKTTDGLLERLWRNSSQAEWCINCQACHRLNVPSMHHDLDDMIDDSSREISMEAPGVICANKKCRRPLDPKRHGRWVHDRPESAGSFAGYHMPQIIFPHHYGKQGNWAALLRKRRSYAPYRFYNEVLGESYDTSTKLITETDLMRAACLPWENDLTQSLKQILDYEIRLVSADWGGGGKKGTSWTVFTVMGWRGDGHIDVLYSFKSYTPGDPEREAKICLAMLKQFRCHFFVHDFTGQSRLREQAIINAGFPYNRVIPMWYVGAQARRILHFVPEGDACARAHYKLDKSRSLGLTCAMIRRQLIRFFKYDWKTAEEPGLINEFTALVEDRLDSRLGRDVYTIIRQESQPDDFAQTVNQGACALWELKNAWPDVSMSKYEIDPELMQQLSPDDPHWN